MTALSKHPKVKSTTLNFALLGLPFDQQPSTALNTDTATQIVYLGQLREQGLLSLDEFDEKKKELLSRM